MRAPTPGLTPIYAKACFATACVLYGTHQLDEIRRGNPMNMLGRRFQSDSTAMRDRNKEAPHV